MLTRCSRSPTLRTFAVSPNEYDPTVNLEEIAKTWCALDAARRESKDDDIDEAAELRAEAEEFGVPIEKIQPHLDQLEREDRADREQFNVDVWPESLPALAMWREIGHMWVWGAMGGRICLRWETIAARIKLREQTHEPYAPSAIEGVAILERTIVANQVSRS